MDAETMDWREEMNQMLAAFERQATQSLGNIKMAFQRNGLTFDVMFKQYFLQVSNNRLEQVYSQIQYDFLLEEKALDHSNKRRGHTGSASNTIKVKSEPENQSDNLIEIIDSSDEEDDNEDGHTPNEEVRSVTAQTVSLNPTLVANIRYGNEELEDIFYTVPIQNTPVAFNGNQHPVNIEDLEADDQIDLNNEKSNFNRSRSLNLHSNIDVNSAVEMRASGDVHANGTTATTADQCDWNGSSESTTDEQSENGKENFKEEEEDDMSVEEMDDEISAVFIEGKQSDINDENDATDNLASIILPSSSKFSNNVNRTNVKRSVLTQSKPAKGFKCTVCDYIGPYKSNLNQHMRKHTGERPYRCDRCGKGFITLQHLKKHATTHTDIYPFHCKGCFRQFSQKTEKEAHEKECTARHYECHLCKMFAHFDKAQLKTHMRKHSGERPFRCEICMARFAQKGNLKIHLKSIHEKNH